MHELCEFASAQRRAGAATVVDSSQRPGNKIRHACGSDFSDPPNGRAEPRRATNSEPRRSSRAPQTSVARLNTSKQSTMRTAVIAALAAALVLLSGAAAQQAADAKMMEQSELKLAVLDPLGACEDSCPEQRCIQLQCLTPVDDNRVSWPVLSAAPCSHLGPADERARARAHLPPLPQARFRLSVDPECLDGKSPEMLSLVISDRCYRCAASGVLRCCGAARAAPCAPTLASLPPAHSPAAASARTAPRTRSTSPPPAAPPSRCISRTRTSSAAASRALRRCCARGSRCVRALASLAAPHPCAAVAGLASRSAQQQAPAPTPGSAPPRRSRRVTTRRIATATPSPRCAAAPRRAAAGSERCLRAAALSSAAPGPTLQSAPLPPLPAGLLHRQGQVPAGRRPAQAAQALQVRHPHRLRRVPQELAAAG
jgi:hypothetical protein